MAKNTTDSNKEFLQALNRLEDQARTMLETISSLKTKYREEVQSKLPSPTAYSKSNNSNHIDEVKLPKITWEYPNCPRCGRHDYGLCNKCPTCDNPNKLEYEEFLTQNLKDYCEKE